MRSFESLTEREILALAISLEEEDARIYEDFADGLNQSHPPQAEQFRKLRHDEDGHRHRLLELYRTRFGEHVPLIRRQDVRGFVDRPSVWLVRPLGLKAVQKQAEVMELETKRFYEAAGRGGRTRGAGRYRLDTAPVHGYSLVLRCGLGGAGRPVGVPGRNSYRQFLANS
jgi:rubrerythrin